MYKNSCMHFSYDLPQLSFFLNQDCCNNKWRLDFKLDTNNLFKCIVYFFLQNRLKKGYVILNILCDVSGDFKQKEDGI